MLQMETEMMMVCVGSENSMFVVGTVVWMTWFELVRKSG